MKVDTIEFWNNREDFTSQTGEKWVYYNPIWVSDKGRACNPFGDELNCSSQKKWTFKHVPYPQAKTMAIAFKIQDYEKIIKDSYIVTHKDLTKPTTLDNLIVGSRSLLSKNANHANKIKKENNTCPEGFIIVPFSEHYAINNMGHMININNPTKILSYVANGRNALRFRVEGSNQVLYTDILVYMLFSTNLTKPTNYKEYVENYNIIHINNNILDDNIINLELRPKKESKDRQRHLREATRIYNIHEDVNLLMKTNNWTLKSRLLDITTVTHKFDYLCACNELKTKSLIECKENRDCISCIKLKRDSNKDIIFINKEKYVPINGGWISEKGNVLNYEKKLSSISSKGYIKLNGETLNLKVIMAITFKIKNYELLSNTKYKVFQIVNNNDYSLTNLEIRTQSEDTKIRKQDKKQSTENKISKKDVENIEFKTTPLFPNHFFYKNGIYFCSLTNNYSKGTLNSGGYRQITIKGSSYKLHRIICWLFNPKPEMSELKDYEHLQVNHINKNFPEKDNHADNLEWVTTKENIKHGVETNAYKSNKAVNTYTINHDGSKGELITSYKTLKETYEHCDIGKTKLTEIIKSGGGIWKNIYYEPKL